EPSLQNEFVNLLGDQKPHGTPFLQALPNDSAGYVQERCIRKLHARAEFGSTLFVFVTRARVDDQGRATDDLIRRAPTPESGEAVAADDEEERGPWARLLQRTDRIVGIRRTGTPKLQ